MKKLRKRMIFAVFASTVCVFALTWVIFYFSLARYNAAQADGMTQIISAYNGVVPELDVYIETTNGEMSQVAFSEESAFRTRYFVISLVGESVIVDLEHIASVDEETARAMAQTVLDGGRTVGYLEEYRYRVTENQSGQTTVIFMDCSEGFATQRVMTAVLTAISVLFTLLVTLVFSLFSQRALRPFAENALRQKRFITDASHELKTPIAIISANAEVLEYKVGQNEWTGNITSQVSHMREMIDRLLTLSKMEEFSEDLEMERVDVSALASRTLDSFLEVFRQKEAALDLNIAEGVTLEGSPEQLEMLFSILIENASKYVSQAGRVQVALSDGGKRVRFSIFNTAALPKGLDCKKLFDRFYRPDTSRASSTGGQGIGLSIAKKIVSLHGGSISAEPEEDGLRFTVDLPARTKGRGKAG
ncbi:MAG: HAMP domain-containing histidine kinase [Oscillospiraceae bacterium]|nr:HAMP domain-containing histidine kinase [Oscillospiraceae bacterium]